MRFTKDDVKTVSRGLLRFVADVISESNGASYNNACRSIFFDSNRSSYSMTRYYPRNPSESAIAAIGSSVDDSSWDGDIIAAAKKIYNIAKKEEITDDTKTFAIDVLSDISTKASWSSSKREVVNLIEKLANI